MQLECVSLELTCDEIEWLKNFLINIFLIKPTSSVSMHSDCQPAIAIAMNKTSNVKKDIYNWDIMW